MRSRAAGPVLAGLLLASTACSSGGSAVVGAAAPPPATAAPATPPAAAPTPTGTALGSRPATLDALRSAQARRPVSVVVPGATRPAPVEEHTTDPVTGGLDLPVGATTVAWWASGAAPGDGAGSVVLAAHVSYDGQTGPFTRLSAVRPGARVQVASADGSTRTYVVQSRRNAPKGSLDRAGLFRTDGPAALVLLTCGGAYDRATRSFADNVVVTAVPA